MNGAERRRAPRIEVLGRLHGHVVSLDTPVTVREISLVGLSFSAPMAFPIAAEHEFRLTLGDGSVVLLRGRVVRAEEATTADGRPTFVMGVQFVDDEAPGVEESLIGGVVDRLK
jgi:hypothetical protein